MSSIIENIVKLHWGNQIICCALPKFKNFRKLYLTIGMLYSIIKAQQKHRNTKSRKEGKSYVKQILSRWQNDCRS